MRVFRLALVFAALLACVIAGCGSGSKVGPTTVEVTGTVTLAGGPVDNAVVVFSPEMGSDDGRLASQATTDKSGQFKLSTHIGGGKYKSGIMPGKYAVTITKLDAAAIKDMIAPPKNLLPPKYADAKTSPLKAEVAAGQVNDFQLPLTSK